MDEQIRSIGVVGLGKMGAPISRHLLRSGFQVHGFDIDEGANGTARAAGVQVSESPAELASKCDLIIILTAYERQAMEVVLGTEGVAAGARTGTIIGIGATIAPQAMRLIADQLQGRGLVALDMPICRGERAADAGKLLITGGGDRKAFEQCRPAFAAFADAVHYLGPAGSGQVGKMVNNLILWACISANHEGMNLGEKLGVDREAMRAMLLDSSAANWALETRVAELAMPWAEKDMMIVLDEADQARMSLPLAGVIKEVIKGIKIERGDF